MTRIDLAHRSSSKRLSASFSTLGSTAISAPDHNMLPNIFNDNQAHIKRATNRGRLLTRVDARALRIHGRVEASEEDGGNDGLTSGSYFTYAEARALRLSSGISNPIDDGESWEHLANENICTKEETEALRKGSGMKTLVQPRNDELVSSYIESMVPLDEWVDVHLGYTVHTTPDPGLRRSLTEHVWRSTEAARPLIRSASVKITETLAQNERSRRWLGKGVEALGNGTASAMGWAGQAVERIMMVGVDLPKGDAPPAKIDGPVWTGNLDRHDST